MILYIGSTVLDAIESVLHCRRRRVREQAPVAERAGPDLFFSFFLPRSRPTGQCRGPVVVLKVRRRRVPSESSPTPPLPIRSGPSAGRRRACAEKYCPKMDRARGARPPASLAQRLRSPPRQTARARPIYRIMGLYIVSWSMNSTTAVLARRASRECAVCERSCASERGSPAYLFFSQCLGAGRPANAEDLRRPAGYPGDASLRELSDAPPPIRSSPSAFAAGVRRNMVQK